MGLRRGENFWLRLTAAIAQCLRLSERFFIYFRKQCSLPMKTSSHFLNTYQQKEDVAIIKSSYREKAVNQVMRSDVSK